MTLNLPLEKSMIKRPMRAYKESVDPKEVRYPAYVSPKYDGIQGLVTPDLRLVSRRLRRIPNRHAQKLFEDPLLIGMAGELIAGPPTAPDVMSRTQTAVMSEDAVDKELRFYVFDWFLQPNQSYEKRLHKLVFSELPNCAEIVPQLMVTKERELIEYEEKCVKEGYEGIMIRSPGGIYKQGRSTLSEGYLLKLKRFVDSEAVILDIEEMMHNDNEATIDARGYTKRSKKKEGMRPAGMLGRFLCRDRHYFEHDFYLGAGPMLTLEARIGLWKIHHQLKGKLVKYRFQNTGVKDRPRFGRALGFRDVSDL